MKIGLLISIREKSKRLPGKVLKKIINQNVTEHLIDRLKLASGYDQLIIATSDDQRDKVFEGIALSKGIEIFYGSQDDKLLRYLQICEHFDLDAVIIVDGDDILCFPEIIAETTNILRDKNNEVVFWKDLPLGAACSGLTRSSLEKVMQIKSENDTEVWGGYFTRGDFKVCYAKSNNVQFNYPEIRLTLDYQEDLDFFETVFKELYPHNPKFSSEDLMSLLINKKELLKINESAASKYEEHLKKAASVKFKKDQKI